MRMKAILPVLTLLLAGAVASGGEEATEGYPALEKWSDAYLEKQFGLKLKSVKYDEDEKKKTNNEARVTCLFEFTKDADDLKALRATFAFDAHNPKVLLYLFDAENAVVTKVGFGHSSSEGDTEITGKQGDTFRMHTPILRAHLDKAKKLEFRRAEPK